MSKSNRLLAVKIINSVVSEKGSLSSRLSSVASRNPEANLPLIREFTFGVCRWYHRLSFIADRLMKKPLRKKDSDVHCLILLGLYQMIHMRTPDHAAINETVGLVRLLKKDWAKGLVNAVLRNAQREYPALEKEVSQQESALYSHPDWLISAIRDSWPDHSQSILEANNIQAPMSLRLNLGRCQRNDFLAKLAKAGIAASAGLNTDTAVILDSAMDVSQIPGFAEGLVSVQDEASQLAAALLDPARGEKILDACAAPGGKTSAILEAASGDLHMLALDNSEQRLEKVKENLLRLKLQATIKCADAEAINSWWNDDPFDAILLDAPCSGTGVIRRHPDIKLLRHKEDIERLAQIQHGLIRALWPCLKKGGRLLYSTCSVLRAENEEQVARFLEDTIDAKTSPISHAMALPCSVGIQFLPGNSTLDGFYYALLEKC